MSKRRQVRRRPGAPGGLASTPRPWGTLAGVPVYDGTIVEPLVNDDDGRVVLGIGPSGGKPRAYVLLCPCDGVTGLVTDLRDAAAIAAEHHPPHPDPMARVGPT